MDMFDAERAIVRPRVLLPGSDEPLLLDDEVGECLAAGCRGLIALAGPPGSGRNTALKHLQALFGGDPRLLLVDAISTGLRAFEEAAAKQLVICIASHPETVPKEFERWLLAPWTADQRIEYLLAVHHDACASVMRRVQADPVRKKLRGAPGLWRVVLDRMATDESLVDICSALRRELHSYLTNDRLRSVVGCYTLALSCHAMPQTVHVDWQALQDELAPQARALIEQPIMWVMAASDYVAGELRGSGAEKVLAMRLPRAVSGEVALLIVGDVNVFAELGRAVEGSDAKLQSTAATLLHAAGVKWVPSRDAALDLTYADLRGITWHGIMLSKFDVKHANLSGADLSDTILRGMNATKACLTRVRLCKARIGVLVGHEADFVGADLSQTTLYNAVFDSADLRDTDFTAAQLRNSRFVDVDLTGARLRGANLTKAFIHGTKIDGADFSAANLSGADLKGMTLRGAVFDGACFANASLHGCDLEGMTIENANFEVADLNGAHLTGSRLPEANFVSAKLTRTGLAEIDWERADLRNADLRGSTFHLGSTRSGLVGSPIASEGSRTGFYTDDYNEQDFKAPEEIRKANLCGADLRGARIDNVDFYLVDLRGARFTPEQEEHLRRSGAILELRV